MTVNDRIRITKDCWARGFLCTIITVDVSQGTLRYGVRPDPECANVACLWFLEGEFEKLISQT